jgi:GGDEF domain-containing protein
MSSLSLKTKTKTNSKGFLVNSVVVFFLCIGFVGCIPKSESSVRNSFEKYKNTVFDQEGFECSSKVVPSTFYEYGERNYKLPRVVLKDLFLKSMETKNLVDPVTGFDLANDRIPTLILATKFAMELGVNYTYVEIDLKNLGGLNSYLGANQDANTIYRMMSDTVHNELRGLISFPWKLCAFRHGGDEFSFVLWGDIEASKIDSALISAQKKIAEEVGKQHLDKIEHPKHPKDPKYAGTGIYFGISQASDQFPKLYIPFGTPVPKAKLPNQDTLKKISIEMILEADKQVNLKKL